MDRYIIIIIKDTFEDGETYPLYAVKKEEICEPSYAEVNSGSD